MLPLKVLFVQSYCQQKTHIHLDSSQIPLSPPVFSCTTPASSPPVSNHNSRPQFCFTHFLLIYSINFHFFAYSLFPLQSRSPQLFFPPSSPPIPPSTRPPTAHNRLALTKGLEPKKKKKVLPYTHTPSITPWLRCRAQPSYQLRLSGLVSVRYFGG